MKSRDAENIKLPAGIDPIIGWLSHILLIKACRYTPHVSSILTIDPMVFFMLNKAHAAVMMDTIEKVLTALIQIQ